MNRFVSVAVLASAALVAGACGKPPEQARAEQAAAEANTAATKATAEAAEATRQADDAATGGLAEAAKGLEDMAKAFQGVGADGKVVSPVSFKALQGFFPELDGWTRGKPTGERVSFGIQISNAQVAYTKGDARITMKITDSTFSQAFLAPFAMMLTSGYERETSSGYEKSATVAGMPGWEKWDGERKHGEVNALVAKRFLVEINGRGIDDPEPLHALATHANLAGLADLK
jgi:hypothetical protein